MNNDSLPTASSPRPTDDAEVLSQRGLNQGGTVPEVPQGDIPWALTLGVASLAPSRIRHRNLQWFRILSASPSLRGASHLCRWPLSAQRHRPTCWKCFVVLPL